MKKKLPLTIIYKNGVKVQTSAVEFSFTINGNTRDFQWKDMDPNALWMNVDEVYAVYEGHV